MTQISEAVECLEELGYTVIAPIPPKVGLPTEPGVYKDVQGDTWALNTGGRWACWEDPHAEPDRFAPFTKLEPVPVTAKGMRRELLARQFQSEGQQVVGVFSINDVAAEFGVTE